MANVRSEVCLENGGFTEMVKIILGVNILRQ